MKKINWSILLLVGLTANLFGNENKHEENYFHKTGELHWGYSGENSPEFWGKLDKSYKTCQEGERQSPINILTNTTKVENSLNYLYFDYKDIDINIVNNGHTIQVNSDDKNYALIQGKRFKLLQFHFHSLSEHTINDKHYPIEVHLVHKSEDGELAVIAIFLKVGSYNKTIQKVFKLMPKEEENKVSNFKINPNNLLPNDRGYYHYLGSLTTPPCTQIVEWYIMKEAVEISEKQLKQFNNLYSGNYRPTSSLHNRIVLEK